LVFQFATIQKNQFINHGEHSGHGDKTNYKITGNYAS
jgi:hypothetical protein